MSSDMRCIAFLREQTTYGSKRGNSTAEAAGMRFVATSHMMQSVGSYMPKASFRLLLECCLDVMRV